MNTKFSYLYRDASNYKNYGEVIFPGDYTIGELNRFKNSLDEGEYFIAHQIGIPEVFFDYGELSAEDDHCWHKYLDLCPTEEEPTDTRTFRQFVEDVEKVSREGWEEFDNHLGTHL